MTAPIVAQNSRMSILSWGLEINDGEPVGTFGWFDADYRRSDPFLSAAWGITQPGQLWERLAEDRAVA